MFFGVERSCCCGGVTFDCVKCTYRCNDSGCSGTIEKCYTYDPNAEELGCEDPANITDLGCDGAIGGVGQVCNNISLLGKEPGECDTC